MAISAYGKTYTHYGLSTDTKPTLSTNVGAIIQFVELDTGKKFVWQGEDIWTEVKDLAHNKVWDSDSLAWVAMEQPVVKTDNLTVSSTITNFPETQEVTDYEPAKRIFESGDIMYVCAAPPGSVASNAVWRVKKVDMTSGIIITFADGNENYDNVATDLVTVAALNYS